MARHISAPAAEPPSLRPYSLQELLCGARSLEATMRILKLIVGACLLLSLSVPSLRLPELLSRRPRDCVTHSRPLKNAAVRNNRLSLPDRLVRLLCALAVAMVTTFHVCDALDGKVVELVSVSDKTNGDIGKKPVGNLAAVEKCHVCAVAYVPQMAKVDLPDSIIRIVPNGAELGLSTFDQPIIGPPPRA
jgi:hypothetical protein